MNRMKTNRPINLSDECKTCEERYGSLVMCFDCCMVPLDLLQNIEIKRYKEENNVSYTE